MPRQKKPPPTHDSFVFEVRSASPHYRWSRQFEKRHPDPLSEHFSLKMVAGCLYPGRFKDREAMLEVVGDRDLQERERDGPSSRVVHGVAWMKANKSVFERYAPMPFDACWHLSAAVAVSAVRYVIVHGPVLKRSESVMTSISFQGGDFDITDYVE